LTIDSAEPDGIGRIFASGLASSRSGTADERQGSRRFWTGLVSKVFNLPRIRAAWQVGYMSSTLIPRKLVERTVGGKLLSIETGHLAKQASGSVVVRLGDTMTLVALVAAPGREGLDFFPHTVD
jgi:hypothetical protein